VSTAGIAAGCVVLVGAGWVAGYNACRLVTDRKVRRWLRRWQ
jgi:hypothetical protein